MANSEADGLSKNEIEIVGVGFGISPKYDLDGGETLVNAGNIYELVAGFCPSKTRRTS